MNVAVLFYPISNFRLHFDAAHSAFPLDKDFEQIRSQNEHHKVGLAVAFWRNAGEHISRKQSAFLYVSFKMI
jgi:hypothetical protein